jgi:hypothetical protein
MKMILAALMLAGAAPQNETARAFLERVYADYVLDGLSSLQHVDELFAPGLAAQIRKDAELAGDEVGYLDGDPLCDCQDLGGVKPRIENVEARGSDGAEAKVVMDFGTRDVRTIMLRLEKTSGGWRVADVGTKDEPSLLETLRQSNGGQ